jgi:ribonucleotide reductase beta subunit family protein with ferritin-like domain
MSEFKKLSEMIALTEEALSRTNDRSQPVYQDEEGWIIKYPGIDKLANDQIHAFWPWDEPKVENDIADLRSKCTQAEREGILYYLKMFTHYERRAGDDFWSGRFLKVFKRPEFQRMGSMNAAVENNSHAPFYNEINVQLFVNTPEFYSSWKLDPILKERMSFIGKIVNSKDDLISLAGFTFIEGLALYSAFAYFKHFQVQACGKNLITQICRGISQSVSDENMHAIGCATAYRIVLQERNLTPEERAALSAINRQSALAAYEHERHIVSVVFGFGDQGGITEGNMVSFLKRRTNLCLAQIDEPPLFSEDEIEDDFIESWFYENINSLSVHDFFTGSGSEYHIEWSRAAFDVWSNDDEDE